MALGEGAWLLMSGVPLHQGKRGLVMQGTLHDVGGMRRAGRFIDERESASARESERAREREKERESAREVTT